MAQDEGTAKRVEGLIGFASSVVAPLSVVSALLFYFGYVSSHARYEYFGLDVDTVGLSTQDYVMRSPRPLLVPLLVLAVLGVAFATAHAGLRRRLDAMVADADDDDPVTAAHGRRRLVVARRAARAGALTGQLAMVVGVALLFAYPALNSWPPYALVTPLLLAFGAAVAAYGLRIEALVGRHERTRQTGTLAIYVVLVGSLLWATATFATWSGLGSARNLALHLDTLPGVILDTSERLYLTDGVVAETQLADAPGQSFHYRYRHLRLLIQGRDHLFLIPDRWTASNSTIMVPAGDDRYRVQFRFENDQPG